MTLLGGPKSITDAVKAAGKQVGYRLKWLGSWNINSGIADWDAFFAGCKADNITPEVYWFAWGDFISPSAITNGVQDTQQNVFKTKANLLPLLTGVMAKAKSAGVSPVVVLEGEFNKNGCEHSPEFAAWWDSCEAIIRTCPGAKVVFAAGAWGDLAALASYYAPQLQRSDVIGLQCGFFLPRNPSADLSTVGTRLVAAFQTLGASKPHILYDVFLSTYGGAYGPAPTRFAGGDGLALEAKQTLGIASLAAIPNLTAITYRDLKDNPNMALSNYGGWAERFVGLQHSDGTPKPSLASFLALGSPIVAPPPSDPCAAIKASLAASETSLAASQASLAAANQALTVLKVELSVANARLAAVRSALS